jgi:hypothetical protein
VLIRLKALIIKIFQNFAGILLKEEKFFLEELPGIVPFIKGS